MTDGLQPFLHDAVIALRAPTQAWSRPNGDMRAPIDGVYHGDRRVIGGLTLRCAGAIPEPIATSARNASHVVFDAVARTVDDATPDPRVRVTRERVVDEGMLDESITVASALEDELRLTLEVRIEPDFRPLNEVKAGIGGPRPSTIDTASGVVVSSDAVRLAIDAPGAAVVADEGGIGLAWEVTVPSRGRVTVAWRASVDDPTLVVRAAAPAGWSADTSGADPRLARWVATALGDLEALRLSLPGRPDDVFLAAGAPWFLTLFGRDSLWAARMLLPIDVGIAASTLRVLARLQGTKDDAATEEEPGKIAHELRSSELSLPGEGIVLPPLYYGTVDATSLWVCLLVDAAAHGMPDEQVRELLPALRAALDWIIRSAGDGFLSYIDRTGHGLANQGWKDSGDSVQWRDGTLAAGPIALCEVQGYSYEAATGAADLLDRLGEPGSAPLRAWATALRARFADRFWVETPEGRYPAIALDRDGRAVDTLTSNIGHLLGTGILDPDDERAVAALLVGPSMSSGFGLRTMSTGAAGFWPLSYHCGTVWTHDSAIVAHGMARAGLADEASVIVEGLLAAAEAFSFRMPELHAGDARIGTPDADDAGRVPDRAAPPPYPAACRPQAWAAAAAITCLEIARR
jgi:glycogen debranching enzyme